MSDRIGTNSLMVHSQQKPAKIRPFAPEKDAGYGAERLVSGSVSHSIHGTGRSTFIYHDINQLYT